MRVHFNRAATGIPAVLTLLAACLLVAAPARAQQSSATCWDSDWASNPSDRAHLQSEITQIGQSMGPIQASIKTDQEMLEFDNSFVARRQANIATLRSLEATLQKTIAENEQKGYYESDPNSDLYNPLRNLLKLTQDRIVEMASRMPLDQEQAADSANKLEVDQSKLDALVNQQSVCKASLAKQPPSGPVKANAPLPPFIQNTAKQNQPVVSVKPSPPAQPPPKTPSVAPLAGNWTFNTAGGCQYQGGHVPGVTHEPDGPMQLKSDEKSGYTGTVEGAQIISSVDSGSLSGASVTLTVHPHTYFDDPKTNPPKDPLTGGWLSALTLKGKLSLDGNIVTGQAFHDDKTPDCTFTMTR